MLRATARIAVFGLRVGAASAALLALLLVLLSVAPIPTTAFMVQASISRGQVVDYEWIPASRISPHLLLAVVAAEDQRFADHSGFDFEAIEQAAEHNRQGGRLRGASTISQQVAKNLFLWPGRSYVRKGLEAALTVLVELVWTKARILEVYVNIAEMGDGVFGAGAASRRFFHTSAADLTPSEAALLAAVLPSPATYDAARPSAYVLKRQRWILGQMQALGGPGWLERLDESTPAS